LLYVENNLKPLFLTCGIVYLALVLLAGWVMRAKRLKIHTSY